MPDNKNENHHSGFVTGLLVGIFAGSTGYFLAKTQEGRDFKEKFKEKWQEAQADLPAVKGLKLGDVKVEDILDIVFGDKSWADLDEEEKQPLLQSVRRSKKRKKKPQKFMGA